MFAALFHPRLLLAFALYLAAVVAVELLAARMRERLTEGDRLAEQVWLPLARAAALVLFLLAAYPALYGLPQAPELGQVLAGDDRISRLVNLSLAASLLLPLLPGIGEHRALVLPLQAMALSALLFSWAAPDVPGGALFPTPGVLAGVVALAWLGHRLADTTAATMAQTLERRAGVSGLEDLLYDGLLLYLQTPALLLYTLHLGEARQFG